jgi:hypothetical protein
VEDQIPPQHQTKPIIDNPNNRNVFFVIFLLILFFIASGTAIYTIYQNKQLISQVDKLKLELNQKKLNLTPAIRATPTLKIKPTNTIVQKSTEKPKREPTTNPPENWETYIHENIPDYAYWQGFTLYYPPSWEIYIADGPPEFEILDLSITKDNYRIEIFQGPSGGGNCLYPEDPDKDGMYLRYGEYKEITKNDGSIWRIAYPENAPKDNPRLGICSKFAKDNEFAGTTPAGTISIYIPSKSAEIPQEIYQILEKIIINTP